MSTHLTKEHLNNLNSNFYYYYFDKEKGICEDVPFHSTMKDDLKTYESLKNDSDKLTKAFCYIYNQKIANREEFNNELCGYLYYWIGEKLFNKLNDKSYFSKTIDMLYDRLNKTNLSQICYPLYKDISMESFRKYKLLYDYSKDHVKIALDTVYVNVTCDEEYNNVVQNYINTYMDAYSNCNGKDKKRYDCSNFFNLFKKEDHSKLTSFKCIVRQNAVETLDVQKRPTDPADVREGRPDAVRAADPEFRPDDRNSDNSDSNDRPERANVLVDDASIQMDGKSENAFSKNIVNTTLPLLAASSFTFLLYKVTPAGTFVNKFFGKNKSAYRNIDNIKQNALSNYNYETEEIDPRIGTMNILYNTLSNT